MTPVRRTSAPAALPSRLLGVPLALALGLLGACSGESSDEPGAEGSTPSESASASPSATTEPSVSPTGTAYLPVPSGIELTPPGTVLDLGEPAVVAWRPRQDTVGVLQLRVTQIDETTVKESFKGWKLSKTDRRSTPYFVRVTARNVGGTDLAGQPVPLYLLAEDATLIEASRFAGNFRRCPSTPLPRQVDGGQTQRLCQVYLAPRGREPAGVSFRPGSESPPITWSGDVTPLEPKQPPKPKNPKNKQRERSGRSAAGGGGTG